MPKKTDIIFVLPSLVAGGAERIISFVSQNLDSNKFNTKLLIAGFEKETVYNVDNIEVIYLNKSRVLHAIPAFYKFLSKNKPNIVMTTMAHVNIAMALLSYFLPKIKFIGRESTILTTDIEVRGKKRFSLRSYLSAKLYNKLDLIICQSNDMAKDMIENYAISKSKITIINNPISNIEPLIKREKSDSVKHFVTVGRLSKEKGHLRLIRLLSRLDFPYMYTIIGDGNEKDMIFNEAKKLNVFDKIKHIPHSKNVNQLISQHDMFLQGSYVEGFPNALLESCVAGVPVIAFDVPGGTKEIVEHGVNGFLVNNESDYIKYLGEKVNFSAERIRESVYDKFNQEKILGKYEKVFLDLV